ncbi:MAG: exonuclease SbcCD subunit D [Dehalococcoidia bacterium]|jgi:exonuclease SbcD|nr:exonuclease SbcCD subunit D [Dehalococcoidia bacterium]
MKILHTSDWHIGKKLGAFDRTPEFRAAINELEEICTGQSIDAVLISGDVWDKGTPTPGLLDIGIDAMRQLSDDGNRAIIVIAGNHDSAPFFDVISKILKPFNIHFVGYVKPPSDGGIIRIECAGGKLAVGCIPFLRKGHVVDLMGDLSKSYGAYQETLRNIFETFARELSKDQADGAVTMLMSHTTVNGASIGGGEWSLHTGQDYAIEATSFPSTVQYVAMGHIHKPQKIAGSSVPAEYAGTLLPLDFGERNDEKRVVVVEAVPGAPARLESIPLKVAQRRPLRRLTGSLETIMREYKEELVTLNHKYPDVDSESGPYFDIVVETDGPDTSLSDRIHQELGSVVKIQAKYQSEINTAVSKLDQSDEESYKDYYRVENGVEPNADLLDGFRQIAETASLQRQEELLEAEIEITDAAD